jgi:hypothetical protein
MPTLTSLHGRQLVPFDENVPAPQVTQAVPSLTLRLPAPQRSHAHMPRRGATVPGDATAHATHGSPAADTSPMLHGSHEPRDVDAAVPGAHITHSDEPRLVATSPSPTPAHGWHDVPFENMPTSHDTHSERAALGSLPAGHARHVDEPAVDATVPGGHSEHGAPPTLKCPAPHVSQPVRALFAAEPPLHTLHVDAPSPLTTPAAASAHAMHSVPFALKEPATQRSHAERVAEGRVPGPHCSHVALPRRTDTAPGAEHALHATPSTLDSPTPHSSHDVRPAFGIVPAGQALHSLAPEVVATRPAAVHGVHDTPEAEKLPAGHSRHDSASAVGMVPGPHGGTTTVSIDGSDSENVEKLHDADTAYALPMTPATVTPGNETVPFRITPRPPATATLLSLTERLHSAPLSVTMALLKPSSAHTVTTRRSVVDTLADEQLLDVALATREQLDSSDRALVHCVAPATPTTAAPL